MQIGTAADGGLEACGDASWPYVICISIFDRFKPEIFLLLLCESNASCGLLMFYKLLLDWLLILSRFEVVDFGLSLLQ